MTDGDVRFSEDGHIEAVIKRRVKFVVEKGAMARLFKQGTHGDLQEAVRQRIDLNELKSLYTQPGFDAWHRHIVLHECWAHFTSRRIEEVRWGHFAKLINIVLYELVANNEIMTYEQAERLRAFLHVPIDQKVLNLLRSLTEDVRLPRKLLGMEEAEYKAIQETIREEAGKIGIPAIWFEDAYSHDF